jgi:hypothetical protein
VRLYVPPNYTALQLKTTVLIIGAGVRTCQLVYLHRLVLYLIRGVRLVAWASRTIGSRVWRVAATCPVHTPVALTLADSETAIRRSVQIRSRWYLVRIPRPVYGCCTGVVYLATL